MKVSVIIPCAGSGNRFGELKQFKKLNGEPLLFFALEPFLDLKEVLEIIIAVPKNKVNFVIKIFKFSFLLPKNRKITTIFNFLLSDLIEPRLHTLILIKNSENSIQN